MAGVLRSSFDSNEPTGPREKERIYTARQTKSCSPVPRARRRSVLAPRSDYIPPGALPPPTGRKPTLGGSTKLPNT